MNVENPTGQTPETTGANPVRRSVVPVSGQVPTSGAPQTAAATPTSAQQPSVSPQNPAGQPASAQAAGASGAGSNRYAALSQPSLNATNGQPVTGQAATAAGQPVQGQAGGVKFTATQAPSQKPA